MLFLTVSERQFMGYPTHFGPDILRLSIPISVTPLASIPHGHITHPWVAIGLLCCRTQFVNLQEITDPTRNSGPIRPFMSSKGHNVYRPGRRQLAS